MLTLRRFASTRWSALFIIAGIWCVSLVLPAVTLEGSRAGGWYLLVNGWRATEMEIYAWYANPLFLLGILTMALGWPRLAAILSFCALLLGLTTLYIVARVLADRNLPIDIELHSGFYVWSLAFAALVGYSLNAALGARRPSSEADRDRA